MEVERRSAPDRMAESVILKELYKNISLTLVKMEKTQRKAKYKL